MKAAIFIGISKYSKPLSDLAACRADAELMHHVVAATAQFEELLCIIDNTTGAQVKAEIAAWIEKLQTKTVDEILFYYTGHGDFFNGEFYYPLSDFDKGLRQQTSLTNSEVDSWLRSLDPKLAVKIVDACHAGIPYVKDDTQVLEKYLRDSGSAFKKCYFMFSSALEQSSYQDDKLSFFTRVFVQAIEQHAAKTIRYRDIMDYTSDHFSSNALQTPFFVVQAHNTEVFCTITDEVVKAISFGDGDAEGSETTEESQPVAEVLTLKQLIQQEARDYCTEAEVLGLLDHVKEMFSKHEYPHEFRELYDAEVVFENSLDPIPRKEAIGEWLKKNQHDYFAESTYGEEAYEESVPVRDIYQTILGNRYPTVTKYRQVIDGYRITVPIPFQAIQIQAKAKYPNLVWHNATLVLLPSKTRVRFFYFYSYYREKNWNDRNLVRDIRWQTTECKWREVENISQAIDNFISGFHNSILAKLEERFDTMST